MVSLIASNKLVSVWRWSSGRRSIAKAKAPVKTISGRIPASSAAAAIGLAGTTDWKKSHMPGTAPTGLLSLSVVFNASADPAAIGTKSASHGVTKADSADELHKTTRKQVTEMPASRPTRLACAVLAMPVMSSETTSGTIVILSPFSHSPPINFAGAASVSLQADPCPTAPRIKPAASATSIGIGFIGSRSFSIAAGPASAQKGVVARYRALSALAQSICRPIQAFGSAQGQPLFCSGVIWQHRLVLPRRSTWISPVLLV